MTRSLPRSARCPTAASSACQIAIASRPIATARTSELAEGCAGEGTQRAGLVAVVARRAERDLQRHPGEEQVDDAVADEAGPGEEFQPPAVRRTGGGGFGATGE